ncbi:MAG: C4-type zinc ribbon domain-containing protein [Gordonia sp. (in: high G+C Gram-positive bacteria)]|uniref:zinc ribbon domain-containing protein n=1 Tax=Gordonia sp. (in: high G+C Gram-positive bacteria) TaxID=84139 RepID=UPI0039E3ECC2
MKVPAADQRVMLEVAEVDADLAKVRHQRAHLPEEQEIADLERKLADARDDAVRADIAAEDLDREYKRLDTEITGMRTREEHDSELLGQTGMAAKALSELQHEVAGLARRRSVAEDELLELMERQEATAEEKSRAETAVADLTADVERVTARRDAAAAELDAKLADLDQRRAAVVAEAPAELLTIYTRLTDHGKVGAGLLRQRRCGACSMELDRGTVAQIAAADDDEVIRCEECGALLIRTHESGL